MRPTLLSEQPKLTQTRPHALRAVDPVRLHADFAGSFDVEGVVVEEEDGFGFHV